MQSCGVQVPGSHTRIRRSCELQLNSFFCLYSVMMDSLIDDWIQLMGGDCRRLRNLGTIWQRNYQRGIFLKTLLMRLSESALRYLTTFSLSHTRLLRLSWLVVSLFSLSLWFFLTCLLTGYIYTQRLGEWKCFKIAFCLFLNLDLIVFRVNWICMVRKWSFAMTLYDSTASSFVFRFVCVQYFPETYETLGGVFSLSKLKRVMWLYLEWGAVFTLPISTSDPNLCKTVCSCWEISNVISLFCAQIFETFLRSEYGGPGTLLVVPFIDMADTLNERELPGGPQAARAAIKWAQDHVDKDWKEWTGTD